MNDTLHYALLVLFSSAVGLVAVLANRLTERVKVPVALLVLLIEWWYYHRRTV